MASNRIPLRCIGGPKDGDVLLVPEGQGYVVVVKDEALPHYFMWDEKASVAVDVKRYEYRVEVIRGSKRTFRFLVEQGLTVDDAFERLLLCYNPRAA